MSQEKSLCVAFVTDEYYARLVLRGERCFCSLTIPHMSQIIDISLKARSCSLMSEDEPLKPSALPLARKLFRSRASRYRSLTRVERLLAAFLIRRDT